MLDKFLLEIRGLLWLCALYASLNPGHSPALCSRTTFLGLCAFQTLLQLWERRTGLQSVSSRTGHAAHDGSSWDSYWRVAPEAEGDRELAPPSHLLPFKSVKKQNLRQGGGDICRGINREAERQRLTRQSSPLPYRPPSGGGMLTTHLKRRRA